MNIILGLQLLVAAATLSFGVVALRVSRRLDPSSLYVAAWLVTGLAFTMEGVSHAIQSSCAVWAVAEGKGSVVWDTYVQWSTVGNHGRSVLKIGLGLALIALPVARRIPPRLLPAAATGWLLLFVVLGSLLGWSEGAFRADHFSTVALLDALEMMVTWGALLGALFVGGIDRFLWIALAINGFRQALNVIWTSAMAWFDTPGAWAPSATTIQVYACVALFLMTVLAVKRLRLARRGVSVSGLFEFPQRTVGSMLS